jgi:hypothetical protein
MEQITEDYCNFDTAKLLKEKGFDEECQKYYGDYKYPCPTLQMAMKWLRKVHEIFIRPNISFLYPIRYYCEIFCYGDNLKTQQDITTENFESPEEACEAAIRYCLENLI